MALITARVSGAVVGSRNSPVKLQILGATNSHSIAEQLHNAFHFSAVQTSQNAGNNRDVSASIRV